MSYGLKVGSNLAYDVYWSPIGLRLMWLRMLDGLVQASEFELQGARSLANVSVPASSGTGLESAVGWWLS